MTFKKTRNIDRFQELVEWRSKNDLSQEQAARFLGVNLGRYAKWERGDSPNFRCIFDACFSVLSDKTTRSARTPTLSKYGPLADLDWRGSVTFESHPISGRSLSMDERAIMADFRDILLEE